MPTKRRRILACSGSSRRAGAQADRLDRQGRQRTEPLDDGRQDRGAGGRGQLHLDHRLGQRNASEQLGRGGRGQRHPAVGRLDPAAARRDRAGLEAIDAQQVEPDRRADDVDDRVDRADFVKMDLGQVDAVDPRLGLAQLEEDPLGQVFLPGRQDALVDDRLDVVPVAMGVLVRGVDLGVGRPEAARGTVSNVTLPGSPRLATASWIGRGSTPASTRAPASCRRRCR